MITEGIKMFLGLSQDIWIVLTPIVVAVITLIGNIVLNKLKKKKSQKNIGNTTIKGNNNSVGGINIQGSNNTIENNNSLQGKKSNG